jgi:hypothetical protein
MTARAPHFRIRLLAALAAAFASLAFVSSAAASESPIPNPTSNRTPSQATENACFSDQTSQTCTNDALADLNAARVSEGVVPMVLPGDWNSLTIEQQLLVVSNLERIDRGLAAIQGLTTNLNANAQNAANNDADPDTEDVTYGYATGAWEGGYVSPLMSDFAWVYDDGYGSGNLDCTSPTDSGCWGHRDGILVGTSEPVVMGAGYDPNTKYGPSESEIFVGSDTQAAPGEPDAPIAPTWATIASTLPIGLSTTSLSLPSGSTTAQLTVWASGEVMHVSAAVTSSSDKWRVSPASCQLNPGQTCTLTLKTTTATPGSGTLTLTGPNGKQTVTLKGRSPKPVTPKISAKLNHSKISRGKSVKLSGSVSTYAPGTYVELQQRHGKSWRKLARVELRLGGKFSFTIKGRSKGKYSYRVSIAANGYFRSAASKTVTLRVV